MMAMEPEELGQAAVADADMGYTRSHRYGKKVVPTNVVQLPDPAGPVDLDVLVSDLANAVESTTLGPLLREIARQWPEEDSRCGTVYVSNESDGNGLVVLHLRFPLDNITNTRPAQVPFGSRKP